MATTPTDETSDDKPEPEKLPGYVHAMCGWPLFMVAIGGAIGGGLGGAAYGVNMAIYKSKLPTVAKIVLNILTGVAAFAIWFVIALSIQAQFPRR